MSDEVVGRRRPAVSLSRRQRLDVLYGLISLAISIAFSLVSGVFRGKNGARTYRRHVITSGIKALTYHVNSLGIQLGLPGILSALNAQCAHETDYRYISPTWDAVYHEFCRSHGIEPDIATSNSEAMGFWIGSKSAKYIIIHFHGGGFALDITLEHLQFWHKIQTDLARTDVEIAIFFPIYTLVPHAAYPTQFQQAAEALTYVLRDLDRDPRHVLLAGDSAGANLCVSILSHLSHPSPDVPSLKVRSKLKGMILMSPWLSFDTSWPSMTSNLGKDIDRVEPLQNWAKSYLRDRPSDSYTEAVVPPFEWWEDSKVFQTLVAVGSDEVFIDSVKVWTEAFKAAGNKTTLEVAEGEFHIESFIAPKMGDYCETKTERSIKSWLRENLRRSSVSRSRSDRWAKRNRVSSE